MQTIKLKNLKDAFSAIDNYLSAIEVKGDSVRHLVNARDLLGALFEQIVEITDRETEVSNELPDNQST